MRLEKGSNLKVFVVAVGFLAFRGGPAGFPGEIGAIFPTLSLVSNHDRWDYQSNAKRQWCLEWPVTIKI